MIRLKKNQVMNLVYIAGAFVAYVFSIHVFYWIYRAAR